MSASWDGRTCLPVLTTPVWGKSLPVQGATVIPPVEGRGTKPSLERGMGVAFPCLVRPEPSCDRGGRCLPILGEDKAVLYKGWKLVVLYRVETSPMRGETDF